MPRNTSPLPPPARPRWEWEGITLPHREHRRGVTRAETRDDLALRLASRSIELVYAFERQPGPRPWMRWVGHAATLGTSIAAAALCPAWAAGCILGAVAALVVTREVPA